MIHFCQLVGPRGIEPLSQTSEDCILSIELRTQMKKGPEGPLVTQVVQTVESSQHHL